MSKMIISNYENWFSSIKKSVSPYFHENSSFCMDGFYSCVFKKLNIDNINYYVEGEDFVYSTGTIIYDGKFGIEALQKLLRDAKTQHIKELRSKMIGSFAIVYKIDSLVRCFVDEVHTFSFYYFVQKDRYVLTNSFYNIAKCVGIKLNDYALLERGVRRSTMSNITPCQGIFKLCAGEYFEVDLLTKSFGVYPIELNQYESNICTREEYINCIYESVKNISSIRSKHIHNYLHFLTGGIDSRLEFAINIFNNDSIKLGYWMGNDVITNGTASDLEITKRIAEKYDIPFECFEVSESYSSSISNIDSTLCDKYGEYASLYCGNSKWFGIFENMDNIEYIGFGYLGESLRELSDLDRSYDREYDLEKFIKEVYCRTGLEKYVFHLDGFYSNIEKELLALKKNKSKKIDKTEAFCFFTYSRYEADCIINNFVNLFCYSFPVFGQKRVADVINALDYEWLKDDYVSLSLINRFDKKLLDFSIYSHHRKFVCHKDSLSMKKSFKYVFFDFMKKKLFNTPIYSILYLKFLHKFIRPKSISNKSIIEYSRDLSKELNVLKDSLIKMSWPENFKGIVLRPAQPDI